MVKVLMAQGERLKVALEAVGMASSSYYYKPVGQRKPRSLDATLVAAISEVRRGHAAVYGYRKVTMALREGGLTINTKRYYATSVFLGLPNRRR
jgi:hypothetical protein